jgi:phage-related minor tail protein
MSGTFSVEWLPGGVLMQRRTGVLTPDQANDYVAAVKRAVEVAPTRWGCVVDTRDAVAQGTDVQEIIQGLITFVNTKGVRRVALVSTRATTEIQQLRVTTAPGMHDPSTVAVHKDLEQAVADVRAAVMS